ncbi:hypothetical protein V1511DRAFT_315941 [Dipodascopsis uninucleata]
MEYFNMFSWAIFLAIFTATALYATRKKWEPFIREHVPLYDQLVGRHTNLRGRDGAGYLVGSTNGALPTNVSLLPISATSDHSVYPGLNSDTFQSDLANGLSSDTFSLRENISAGDSRAGLQDDSKAEIQTIMRELNIGFDDARAIYTRRVMELNGVGPDGRPQDPRAVFFS